MTDLIPNKYEALLRNAFLAIIQAEGPSVALQKWNNFWPGGPKQDQAALEELLGVKPGQLALLYTGEVPGPAPTPTFPPASVDYNPRYWYGAVNSVASMGPDEQRNYVQACAAMRIGILLEYVGWSKGNWWRKRAELMERMRPFFEEARRLRVPVHIYIINGNLKEGQDGPGRLTLSELKLIANDVIALADPSKDRILAVNETGEMDQHIRWEFVGYVQEAWTGALVSYGNGDNPNHPRVVVCEKHPQSHTDFKPVASTKPTFFVSDNHPMIQWLSNSSDSNAQRFDQGRVRQWKGELPNSAAGQGYYGWMHEHADMATIATLG